MNKLYVKVIPVIGILVYIFKYNLGLMKRRFSYIIYKRIDESVYKIIARFPCLLKIFNIKIEGRVGRYKFILTRFKS